MNSPNGTPAEALAAAFAHHQAGRLAEAEGGYRRFLAEEPGNVMVMQLLAILSHQIGHSDAAMALLRQAIAVDPAFVSAHANLGIVLEERGDIETACACYRRAAVLQPLDAKAHIHLARVLVALGEAVQAAACLRRASELQPEAPPDPGVHIGLGNLLLQQGDVAGAVACYEQAVAGAPDLAIAHSNLGNALRHLHRPAQAVACLERALALDPELAEAHNNLGIVHLEAGLLPQAVACFERSLALRSDFVEAHSNLGNALQTQGRLDDAIARYDYALTLAPDYHDALLNCGNALWLRGRLAEAIACYERAVALRPDDPVTRAHLAHPRALACAWDERDADESAALSAMRQQPGSVPPFNLLSQRSTPAEQLRCAQGWARRLTAGCRPALPRYRARTPGRIRLGYISADFREHPVAWAMVGLFEAHDRAGFEVHTYSYGPDDGSALRTRIAAGSDSFTDLRALSDAAAAQRIHDDGIDILVDLTGYTLHARPRILTFRLAPVQVNFLGYCGTMGAEFVDAIVVDPLVVPPEQQPFFTERLLPVQRCWWPAAMPRAISERTPSRQECGLPAEGFVFACFNNSYKITPEMFGIWMRLLAATPGSVLWLAEPNRLVPGNLRREAARRGVAPERLVFSTYVPTEDHFARHRLADLFLDTLPYNACTTAYDALWAGLPVLTCAGATFAGRMAATMLHVVGLPELVATSLPDYEARGRHLAREPALLARLRERLAEQRTGSPLFDSARAARDLEAGFGALWHAWCTGEGPLVGAINAPLSAVPL